MKDCSGVTDRERSQDREPDPRTTTLQGSTHTGGLVGYRDWSASRHGDVERDRIIETETEEKTEILGTENETEIEILPTEIETETETEILETEID